METPVQKIITLAEEGVDLQEGETRKVFRTVRTILLQDRCKEDNQEKCDDRNGELGRETRGKEGGDCSMQAYAIGHDKE